MNEMIDTIIKRIEGSLPDTPDRSVVAAALARDILEDLAEPTTAMITAGTPLDWQWTSTEAYQAAAAQAAATWRAMIKATLA